MMPDVYLQTVCGGGGGGGGEGDHPPDGDIDDDIYFLDEFGNYVFPVTSPPPPPNPNATDAGGGGVEASNGSLGGITSGCSCRPSREDGLDSDPSRRVSQVKQPFEIPLLCLPLCIFYLEKNL